MGKWLEVPADEFCSSVRDGTHDSPKPVEDGCYLITSRHIIGDRIDLSNAYRISQSDFDEINRRSKVDQWDVLITMIGTVGDVCIVREKANFAIKNIGLFKAKSELRGKWLYYYMKSPFAKARIESHKRGTTQAYIPLGELRKFPIKYPEDESLFGAIISLLTCLDDKIELNRRMNETLEAMARALFKDWFVDFGPTRTKMAMRGEDPQKENVAREPYLAPEIWDLFPDRLDADGKPEGWGGGTLNDIAELNPESWLARNTPETVAYVDLANTKWGNIDNIETYDWANAPSRARRILRPGDTIVGTVRPGNGSYSYISDDGLTGSTGFAVLRPNNARDRAFVWASATAPDNIDRLAHVADGGAYPAVRPDVVAATEAILPDDGVLAAYNAVGAPLIDRVEANKRESRTLAQTRDLLLPKLMSGEVRVADAVPQS